MPALDANQRFDEGLPMLQKSAGKKMEKNRTHPGMDRWFVPSKRPGLALNSTPIGSGEVFSIFFI
jgi:hypothetical protein